MKEREREKALIQFHAIINKISENSNSRNRFVRFQIKTLCCLMIVNDVFSLIFFFQKENILCAVNFFFLKRNVAIITIVVRRATPFKLYLRWLCDVYEFHWVRQNFHFRLEFNTWHYTHTNSMILWHDMKCINVFRVSESVIDLCQNDWHFIRHWIDNDNSSINVCNDITGIFLLT